MAWISDNIPIKVWAVINHQCLNFGSGFTVDVMAWVSSNVLSQNMDIIIIYVLILFNTHQ